MIRIFDIRVQKLFPVVLALKVTASALAWALQRPWGLGFALPIALMLTYIMVGLHRRADDVTDEKFADTCYYLGFIFTITSIIFALFDLPQVGTRIDSIAVRFGAAMVTTVLGLAVRVYLVSFERDTGDALREAEAAVLESARRLREQLGLAFERLRDFEAEVDLAAKGSVERVNLHLEALGRQHVDRLGDYFDVLARHNQAAFDAALVELGKANARLAASFEEVGRGVQAQVERADTLVAGFLEAVNRRLEASVFPPDYFAKYLASPLAQLRSASEDIASHVSDASTTLNDATGGLVIAARRLRLRTDTVEGAFDTVARLVQQQEKTLETVQRHMAALTQVAASLQGLDVVLDRAAAGVEASGQAAASIVRRWQDRPDEGAARERLEGSVERVVERLDEVVAQLQGLRHALVKTPARAGVPDVSPP